MTNWDDFRIFLALAATGTMLAASRQLGISQPTVGRRLNALESELGVKLFKRSTRGLQITEAGESVLEHARDLERNIVAIERAASGFEDRPLGMVNISTTECFAINVLVPALQELRHALPGIQIHLTTSPDFTDLSAGKVDIVMRFSRPGSEGLVGRCVNQSRYGLYASEAYLQGKSVPQSTAELSSHSFIQFGDRLGHTEWAKWLRENDGAGANFVGEQLSLVRSAVSSGLGIGILPRYASSPDMVQILPGVVGWSADLWLLCHPDQRRIPRISETMRWLNRYFSNQEL